MIKVVIVCAIGMSSSMLLDHVKRRIEESNDPIIINSMTYIEIEKFDGEFDVLLLAPQISHLYERYLELYQDKDIMVDKISLKDLGLMDADKVIKQIKENYERIDRK